MAEIVNLNRFRKQTTRARDKAQADENAVKFGRTKAQKAADQAERNQVEKTLDQGQLDE